MKKVQASEEETSSNVIDIAESRDHEDPIIKHIYELKSSVALTNQGLEILKTTQKEIRDDIKEIKQEIHGPEKGTFSQLQTLTMKLDTLDQSHKKYVKLTWSFLSTTCLLIVKIGYDWLSSHVKIVF